MRTRQRRVLRRTLLATAVLGKLLTLTTVEAGARTMTGKSCDRKLFAGSSYTVCKFDVARTKISIRWRNREGRPYGSLAALRRHFARDGRQVLFAMNAGMYHEDLSPVGYYVEARKKLKNANTRRGPGNFHMLPNGIFFVENARAGVMETRAFLKRNRRPLFATQSGPMLVIGGRTHPRFNPTSKHRKLRNGVGVSGDGRTVYFAISDDSVTFYNFAKLFQVKLGVPNALFLDGGSAPQMMAPGISRPSFAPVGPVVVVTAQR
ncbi:MAG: phosphodiester glycosidase family protein [Hyphomicrobiaceae bacterium]